jgi:hypothetical protein
MAGEVTGTVDRIMRVAPFIVSACIELVRRMREPPDTKIPVPKGTGTPAVPPFFPVANREALGTL